MRAAIAILLLSAPYSSALSLESICAPRLLGAQPLRHRLGRVVAAESDEMDSAAMLDSLRKSQAEADEALLADLKKTASSDTRFDVPNDELAGFDEVEALKNMPMAQKVVVGIGLGGLLAFVLLLIFI